MLDLLASHIVSHPVDAVCEVLRGYGVPNHSRHVRQDQLHCIQSCVVTLLSSSHMRLVKLKSIDGSIAVASGFGLYS